MLLSICQPEPLSYNEKIFKEMYLNYPDLHLDLPCELPVLDAATNDLPEYKQLHHKDPQEFPTSSVFGEEGFEERANVVTRMHERYSPCFIHEHDFFEIIYVIKGSCTNYLAGVGHEYHEGDICILAPHTRHAISVFSDHTIILNILLRASTFRQTFFSALQGKGILSDFFSRALFSSDGPSHLYFHMDMDAQLLSIADDILKENAYGRRYAESISSTLVTLFFLYLLRNHEKDLEVPNPTGRDADSNIMFILNYLMAHYDSITLTELASFFNYSERQLTRLLKDYTGENFTDIVRRIRLEKACTMLKIPEMPIPEIIAAVGYSNATHFYTLFKKEYGMTPAAYREANLS